MHAQLIDFRTYCKFSNKSQNDPSIATMRESINQLIKNASDLVARYCNREFDLKQRTVTTTPARHVSLPAYPVSKIISVRLDCRRVFDDSCEIKNYSINANSGVLSLDHFDRDWPENTMKVVFVAGFEEIPFDLQEAIFKLVNWSKTKMLSDRIGVRSVLSGDVETTFELNVPWEVKTVLDGYTRK